MSSRKNFDTRRFTCKAALFLAAFSFAGSAVNAEESPEAGAFFFKQYLPEEYGADAQNWAVVQDARGIMFFGNTEGLLEYDGARWTHIQLPNAGSIVRSLGVNANGTVYVGGQNEFGFLKENANGILRYVSLLDRVPASDRNFGDIWTICVTRTGIFFGSSSRIFRWSPETGMTVWKAPTRFGRLFTADDLPYVLVNGSGLHRISGGYIELVPGGSQRQASGNKLEPVPGGEQFPRQIRGVFSFAGSLMIATPNALYRQEGNKFVQFSTDADELLRKAEIYVCAPLSNGDLSIGTIQGGLILLTPAGRVEKIINKQTGLASNYVNAIYNDRAGSVWLALNLGIAHIESQLPLTRFGDRQGVDEAVAAIQRHGGNLYAGTLSGLTKLFPGPGAHFEPVSGIRGGVLSLLSTPDGLLIASQYGIWNLGAHGLEVIFLDQTTFALAQSIRDPHLYYAAGRYGMLVLRSDDGHWKKVGTIPSNNLDFLSVVEDLDGIVWATTPRSILRINLGSTPAKIQPFALENGAVGGWNYAYRVGGKVVFATGKGLRRFDAASGHLVAERRFGNMFADGSRDVIRIAETSAGAIWISGRFYNGVLTRSRTEGYAWDEHPLERAGIKELGALFIDPNEVAWASGASGGLVRYSGSNSSSRATAFQAFLSAIQLLRNPQAISTSSVGTTKVPHQQNSMRFEYSAPAFEDETRTEFQVRLDGLDRSWSEWSKETRKEYTNLWEGKYTFKVRARDLHGRISRETSFGFRVLSPWYRTIWAYILYVPILLGSMMLFLKWRTHALKERNRKLEVIIEKRTEEIRQQRDEIKREEERTEALLLNILPAPVAHELRATGKVQPTTYDEITVCFTDFVGFTLSSEKIAAADLVDGLHKYFTAFDEIVGRYGLEKLKTIGDSYMFVGGLPDSRPSHAVDVVMAAFEMLEVIKQFSTSYPHWNVRIGVNSGPVVAGIVGVKKFAYDIWGQTVNFAARFQSSGSPNRINMSSRSYELISEFIECEPRGRVRIKEGRQIEMYFAQQVRPQLLGNEQDGIPDRFAELYLQRFGRNPPAFPSAKSEIADPHAFASF